VEDPRPPVANAGRIAAPEPDEAAPASPRQSAAEQVLGTLQSLTTSKQVAVAELWPGAVVDLGVGIKVTVRSKKERRRFTRPIEAEMLEWLAGFEPGDIFYDIGANCGSLTLATAAMYRDTITIVAFEPGFANFDSLARNLARNDMLGHVVPLQVALLDHTGLQPMNYFRSTAAGTSQHVVGAAVDQEGRAFVPAQIQFVPTFRLDDLVDVLGLPAPTWLKIDVAGSEEALLRGAPRLLAAGGARELVVEVVDHDRAGPRLASVRALLAPHGYALARTLPHHPGDAASYVADHVFRRQLRRSGAGTRSASA
jgi:FkbM family methyltransferase